MGKTVGDETLSGDLCRKCQGGQHGPTPAGFRQQSFTSEHGHQPQPGRATDTAPEQDQARSSVSAQSRDAELISSVKQRRYQAQKVATDMRGADAYTHPNQEGGAS